MCPTKWNPPTEKQNLIVAELGSATRAWMAPDSQNCDQTAVIAQQQDELGAEFARRVVHRAQSFAARDCRLGHAVLVLGKDSTGELSTRVLMARALVVALREGGGSELELIAPERCSDSERHELLAIVDALSGGLNGSSLNVRIQFARLGSRSASNPHRLGPREAAARAA